MALSLLKAWDQDISNSKNGNLNATIKMAAKSAMIDATIRAAGLTDVFVKTHQHTIRNNPTVTSGCHRYEGPRSANQLRDISATQKQIDLITRLAGRKGLTTESLGRLIQEQFNKALNDLTRVESLIIDPAFQRLLISHN